MYRQSLQGQETSLFSMQGLAKRYIAQKDLQELLNLRKKIAN